MKKFLILTICSFLLLFTVNIFASDVHTVKLDGVTSFTISEEFPSNPENKCFRFRLLSDGKIKAIDFALVVGISIYDPNYQMILLLVRVDDRVHVVAVATERVRNGEAVNQKIYKDHEFLKSGKFSGILTKTDHFPGPDEVERVATAKKTQI